MYKIFGVFDKSFHFEDNDTGKIRTVTGFQVFCTDDSRSKVDSVATLDFFMSESVCNRSNYIPKVGDCLDAICYNRFGRLDRVLPSSKK